MRNGFNFDVRLMNKLKDSISEAAGFGAASPFVGGPAFDWARKQNKKSGTKPAFLSPRKSRQELTGDVPDDRKKFLAKYGLFALPNALAFEVEADKKREKVKDTAEIVGRQQAEAAASAEYERTHPAPIIDTQSETLARKRQAARRQRSSGRLSTILSETLG